MDEKEVELTQEEQEALAQYEEYLRETFNDRELRLIAHCYQYANSNPAGLPGHALMVLVAKLANIAGITFE